MKQKLYISLLFAVIIGTNAFAGGIEPFVSDELEQKITEQGKIIDKLMDRIDVLEQNKSNNIEVLPTSLKEISPKAEWAERIKFKGDFRYRHELINDEQSNTGTSIPSRQTRNRQRIRARIQMDAMVNDDIDFVFRLATGDEDPVSTNETLDTWYTKKSIMLDLAYAHYHPKKFFNLNVDGLECYLGKMKMPFKTPGKEQLIWDGDITPEGGAALYSKKFGDFKVFGSLGGFWLDERSNDVDTTMWGMQGGIETPLFMKDIKLVAGCSYYDYQSLKGQRSWNDDSFSGNTSEVIDKHGTARTVYERDYDLVEPFMELHFNLMDIPIVFYADWVANSTTDEDRTGQLWGCKINKCKKPGSWELGYNWRKVEEDSVLGIFTDSDFGGGGTDHKGHKLSAAYQLGENTQIATCLILARRDINQHYTQNGVAMERDSGHDYVRWQLDLKFKF